MFSDERAGLCAAALHPAGAEMRRRPRGLLRNTDVRLLARRRLPAVEWTVRRDLRHRQRRSGALPVGRLIANHRSMSTSAGSVVAAIGTLRHVALCPIWYSSADAVALQRSWKRRVSTTIVSRS